MRVASEHETFTAATNALARFLPERTIHVLEAGGGSARYLEIPRVQHVTVLDISSEQLERNTYADRKILGDLHDPEAITGRFDLIVCFDVLEHLQRPKKAFDNMISWLRPGGLLLIGCPNVFSTKGWLTKLTPHSFHVWYYRVIRSDRNAGKPGYAPFPTLLRLEMSLRSLTAHSAKRGLETMMAKPYVGTAAAHLKGRWPWLHFFYNLPAVLLGAATGGRLDLRNTDYLLLLRRNVTGDSPDAPRAA